MAMAETEAKKAMDLPKGFTPLSDFVELKALPQSVVNVIGLVKDFRRPIVTTGKGDVLKSLSIQIQLMSLQITNVKLVSLTCLYRMSLRARM